MRAFLTATSGIEFDLESNHRGIADGILSLRGENDKTVVRVPVRIFSETDRPVRLNDADRKTLLGAAGQVLREQGYTWANVVSLQLG